MLHTEKIYINDLEVLGLLKADAPQILTDQELIDNIFPPFEELIEIHKEIYRKMIDEIRIGKHLTEIIPQTFIESENDFDIYIKYCGEYNTILDQITAYQKAKNQQIESFLTFCKEHPKSRGLDFESIIIKPVQVNKLK